jgi:hypothetical protein
MSASGPVLDPDRVLLLVRLGHDAGGRVDPARILARKPTSPCRQAFLDAQDYGWLDGMGWVTDAGREALREAETA